MRGMKATICDICKRPLPIPGVIDKTLRFVIEMREGVMQRLLGKTEVKELCLICEKKFWEFMNAPR